VLAALHDQTGLSTASSEVHNHHLGTLLFAFVLLWAYVSFSQFLIVYSGNLPEEISWYEHRIENRWRYVVVAIALLNFLVPFLLLLFKRIKCRWRHSEELRSSFSRFMR
jgi:hypothetical protein